MGEVYRARDTRLGRMVAIKFTRSDMAEGTEAEALLNERAVRGTNADDVTDVLRGLPVAIRKENTSAVWHREEQVPLENPELIVSHLSCFVDERGS